MSALALTFGVAFVISVVLTPVVGALARRWRIVDHPGARRTHAAATPRAGGVAVYVATTLPLLVALGWGVGSADGETADLRPLTFLIGGGLTFALGLWDDVWTLRPFPKLAAQVAVALVAYGGGIHILKVSLPSVGIVTLDWLSLPATILWFVLIINAVNLIDGLDGLAAGIALFAALTLLVILDTDSRFLTAVGLAAVAGAALGFLRHNFYPATIFLGDSGSYFLGYSLAALSILGSVKSEATVAILIPIIALGVPVMDALWAPIRRFILGQRLFHPDRDHIHHRLLKLGYTPRRAVLTLYAITMGMGLAALALVHARDDRAALILLLVGVGVFVGIRKLGYLAFIHRKRVVGWLGTVSDELGLRRSRRSFLECQVLVSQARGLDELWQAIEAAALFLDIDFCALAVNQADGHDATELRYSKNGPPESPSWDPTRTLRVSIPLLDAGADIGSFQVMQKMRNGTVDPYLLRRIDQLGGSIAEALGRLPHRSQTGASPATPNRPAGRVLFLSHYFPPEGNAPATRVHGLCRQWVADGQHVTVITCAPNVPSGVVYEGYRNRLYQRERVDGIDVIRVWTYLAANRGTALRILNYLSYMVSATVAALFTGRCDVVVATSPQFFCGWAGVLVAALRRVPMILEIRDLWPDSIVAVGALRNRRLLSSLAWLERRMYQAAQHIVAVGDGYRDELLKKGVAHSKITVIPNGIDIDAPVHTGTPAWVRERWNLGEGFICAYVGTVGMASGLDVVLRAAEILRGRADLSVRFLIVGDGAVRAELEQAVHSAGLDTVIFTGRQEKRVIPEIIAATDACLVHLKKQPLFATVMPSKMLEAAAMAKPIVLGVEGHAAELLQRAGGGICIEPENADALVTAVESLARNPALGRTLGQRGREFFQTHLDRRALARDYLALLHQVGHHATPHAQPGGVPPSSDSGENGTGPNRTVGSTTPLPTTAFSVATWWPDHR